MPKLVLVGKKAWLFGETLGTVERFGLSDHVIFTGYVPEIDLPALYTGALCFVYPSFFEGFGLPPLESMQCGTPVITGDRTSLPEVVGDAGLLVDPYDIKAIAGAINRLIDDPDLRASLSLKGLQRARQFNWTTTAAMTLAIFERFAPGARHIGQKVALPDTDIDLS
jgi:glycosyltransferase involved in cell wall biosynthesis